jgi:hypothetical protein
MMHERSYTPPFNLNGYESTMTKNLLYRRAYWPRNGKKFERRTKLSKKEAGKRNVWIYAS